jgi:hypothetical protein
MAPLAPLCFYQMRRAPGRKGRLTTVFNCDSIRRECDDSLRFTLVFVIDDIAEGRDSPSAGQK